MTKSLREAQMKEKMERYPKVSAKSRIMMQMKCFVFHFCISQLSVVVNSSYSAVEVS